MIKLRRLLSDNLKIIRHRRLALNIQITFMTWMVELAIFGAAITAALFGISKRNEMGEFFANEMIWVGYTIILPCLIIVRDGEIKDYILQSSWYIRVMDELGWGYKGPMRDDAPAEESNPNIAHAGID